MTYEELDLERMRLVQRNDALLQSNSVLLGSNSALLESNRALSDQLNGVAALASQVAQLNDENRHLREMIELLKKNLFGKRSEKLDPDQLALFEGRTPDAPSPSPTPAPPKPRRGHGRERFPVDLPREEIVCEPSEPLECCGSRMRSIGKETVERATVVPARVVINRYELRAYRCSHCRKVTKGAAPESLVRWTRYEPSVYAHVVVAKYNDHLPLNRQQGILGREGLNLSKQTMWDMSLRVSELLAPVLRQIKREVLSSPRLLADETGVPVVVEGKKGSQTGRVWAYQPPDRSKVFMDFTLTKERDGPIGSLGDWTGTLLVDGAASFDEVTRKNKITRAGCWAHARRKLKEAAEAGSREAVPLLLCTQRLFRIERALQRRAAARSLSATEIADLTKSVRARRSQRTTARIFDMSRELMTTGAALPQSSLGKAVRYLLNQQERLEVCLTDPELPIHNNDSERALRHVVTGRKNWMVHASERGGRVAADLYSLMLTCRFLGVNPDAYLNDVLLQISTTSDVASLTPWAWAKARESVNPS